MTRACRAGRWAVAVAALLLGGCALLKPEEPKAPPPPPAVNLQVEAPDALKPLLADNLDLGRLRTVAAGEPISDIELRRLETATPAEARALLETEGYFDAKVDVERLPGDPPTVQVRVDPGPRARVQGFDLQVQGPLQEAAERGDKSALGIRAALHRDWLLPPGTPFRNPAWADAKTRTIAQLRALGYAAAGWQSTRAQADAQSHQVELSLVVDSGPLFRTGELRIEGLEKQPAKTVRNLANFPAGTPATEALLLDYQERLQKSQLFDAISVTIDPNPATAAAAPVIVRLHEAQLQQATVGVGISAKTGPRVSLEHFARRVFGYSLTARNKFEIGREAQSWDGELSTQTLPGLHRNLLGVTYDRELSSTDVVTSGRIRLGRAQETQRIDRFAFVQVEQSITNQDNVDVNQRADAVSLNYNVTFRDVDNILLPTRGRSLTLQTGAGWARSNTADPGPFTRLYGKLQFWRPFGAWYGLARVELGQVFVRDNVLVPDSQRFRAGGDESVRGYGYRDLGPTVNGVLESGNLLFTSSIELAHPVSAKLPQVLWAVFVDAGNAANKWSDLKPVYGYGAGLRVRSPVGPLKVDLAYGEASKQFRLTLSVGVTF